MRASPYQASDSRRVPGAIILCREDERFSAELIERAGRALYRAKGKNKGGCCLRSAEKDG